MPSAFVSLFSFCFREIGKVTGAPEIYGGKKDKRRGRGEKFAAGLELAYRDTRITSPETCL